MDELVRLELDAGIATIRLDRPPTNALDERLYQGIGAAAGAAAASADVRAVIVYGGRRLLSTGIDVAALAELRPAQVRAHLRRLAASFGAVAAIGKPTVAAISGFALGAGYELALCCDRRIAGHTAMIGQPEILLGLIPGAGGTQRLARLAGPAVAKDLVYTGRFVGADEALALGLVDQVVAPAEVYPAARSWARRFVGGPAQALAAAKAAVERGLDVPAAAVERGPDPPTAGSPTAGSPRAPAAWPPPGRDPS